MRRGLRTATGVLLAFTAAAMPAVAQHFSDWSDPAAIDSLNTESVDGCPFISKDGLSLYLASNRQGGSTKSTPSHFVDENNGQTLLYFHSDRPTDGGPLGTNIFVSTQQTGGQFRARCAGTWREHRRR